MTLSELCFLSHPSHSSDFFSSQRFFQFFVHRSPSLLPNLLNFDSFGLSIYPSRGSSSTSLPASLFPSFFFWRTATSSESWELGTNLNTINNSKTGFCRAGLSIFRKFYPKWRHRSKPQQSDRRRGHNRFWLNSRDDDDDKLSPELNLFTAFTLSRSPRYVA